MLSRRHFLASVLALSLLLRGLPAANLPRKAPELVIHMPGGGSTLLSRYKGKVVAVCFILTTCPHCQRTIGNLSKLQSEFGTRGFQVLASAIETGAALALPRFQMAFNPPFPVGYNEPAVAVDFMQHPPMVGPMMPMLAFVDRQGNIREQHEGDDSKFFDRQEDNLRARVEFYLNESTGGATKAPAKKAAARRKQS